MTSRFQNPILGAVYDARAYAVKVEGYRSPKTLRVFGVAAHVRQGLECASPWRFYSRRPYSTRKL